MIVTRALLVSFLLFPSGELNVPIQYLHRFKMAVWTGAGREVEDGRGRDEHRQAMRLDTQVPSTYMTISVILRYDNIDITFSPDYE